MSLSLFPCPRFFCSPSLATFMFVINFSHWFFFFVLCLFLFVTKYLSPYHCHLSFIAFPSPPFLILHFLSSILLIQIFLCCQFFPQYICFCFFGVMYFSTFTCNSISMAFHSSARLCCCRLASAAFHNCCVFGLLSSFSLLRFLFGALQSSPFFIFRIVAFGSTGPCVSNCSSFSVEGVFLTFEFCFSTPWSICTAFPPFCYHISSDVTSKILRSAVLSTGITLILRLHFACLHLLRPYPLRIWHDYLTMRYFATTPSFC